MIHSFPWALTGDSGDATKDFMVKEETEGKVRLIRDHLARLYLV